MKTIRLDRFSFKFEDIDIIYPIYSISNKAKTYYNFRASISSGSHSRENQLNNRSIQSIIFDKLIEIGYFKEKCNVEIIKEFPLINTRPDISDKRSYYLLDYFIPSKSLCIELDSNFHADRLELDKLKDQFLLSLGIDTFRSYDFHIDTKRKLDDIIKWVSMSEDNIFMAGYSNLIQSYINKLNIEDKSDSLYRVKPKWKKVIKILCDYDKNLENAILTGSSYNFSMNLDEIHQLIPMKEKQVRSYNSLVSQLKSLGIELKITSWMNDPNVRRGERSSKS